MPVPGSESPRYTSTDGLHGEDRREAWPSRPRRSTAVTINDAARCRIGWTTAVPAARIKAGAASGSSAATVATLGRLCANMCDARQDLSNCGGYRALLHRLATV